MALSCEVVDLVGLHSLHNVGKDAGIREFAVVQDEMAAGDVRIFVEMIDAIGVKERGAALYAMHLVTLLQQKLGEICSILSGNTGDEGLLQRNSLLSGLWLAHGMTQRLSAVHVVTPNLIPDAGKGARALLPPGLLSLFFFSTKPALPPRSAAAPVHGPDFPARKDARPGPFPCAAGRLPRA